MGKAMTCLSVASMMQYGVDAYFNGHDHYLDHIWNSTTGIHYIVSGRVCFA